MDDWPDVRRPRSGTRVLGLVAVLLPVVANALAGNWVLAAAIAPLAVAAVAVVLARGWR